VPGYSERQSGGRNKCGRFCGLLLGIIKGS
jgi:hypothetical protein